MSSPTDVMERLVSLSNQSIALNSSESNPVIVSTPPALKQIHDILIVVLLVTVMFAMGCSITWIQVRTTKSIHVLFL